MKMIPLVAVVGPTASGKTDLAVKLAKRFDGEIVSADSMQIYKGMSIATAKPTEAEKDGIVHHLMGFLDCDKEYSVAQFCADAKAVIADIHNRGKLPVLVGGTGLYIDSLLQNITFTECGENEIIRDQLKKTLDENGVDYLLSQLRLFDSDSADRLETEKNPKRIMRAIEVYKITGITQTEHNLLSKAQPSSYHCVKIGLKAQDRQFLYDRINDRVDKMVEMGLVDEAQLFLSNNSSKTSSMAIGYKELRPYFSGERSLDECIENLKIQTRRYAKRQLTWFNRDSSIAWYMIDIMSKNEIFENAVSLIKEELHNEKSLD